MYGLKSTRGPTRLINRSQYCNNYIIIRQDTRMFAITVAASYPIVPRPLPGMDFPCNSCIYLIVCNSKEIGITATDVLFTSTRRLCSFRFFLDVISFTKSYPP